MAGLYPWHFGLFEDLQSMTRTPLGRLNVGAAPLCVRVTVRPPIVSVIVRAVVCPFAVTCTVTVPLPVPLVPLVIETQLTLGLSAAVHVQPLCDVTEIVSAPPAAAMVGVSGETVYVHVLPLGCVTETSIPAMLIVPVREGPVFAAAVKPTVPFPFPLAPLVTVIQPASLTAVQLQPDVVATENVELPPPTSIERLVGVTV
jgi:hypothetical protein